MGIGRGYRQPNRNAGGNLRWTSIPSKGIAILLVTRQVGLRIKRSDFEPWPGSLCCVLGKVTLRDKQWQHMDVLRITSRIKRRNGAIRVETKKYITLLKYTTEEYLALLCYLAGTLQTEKYNIVN